MHLCSNRVQGCSAGRHLFLPLAVVSVLLLAGCAATATANPGSAAPTPVAYLALEDVSSQAKEDREQQFKNSLSLKLTVHKVSKRGEIYVLDIDLDVKNQSSTPVVIGRDWSTSDKGGPVYLRISLDKQSLFYESGFIDRILVDDSHNFLLMQSGASRTFRISDAQIPATARSTVNLQKFDLSGKSLSIEAVYANWRVGYPIEESPFGKQVMFADMNAWVGQLVSGSVQVTFP